MRYLVTGCAGFIGAHVSRRLLDDGHPVTGVDELNAAYDPRLKQWRLDQLQSRPGFRFHRGDIADPQALEAVFAADARAEAPPGPRPPYAAVLNLAARAGIRASAEDPRSYYRSNVDGVLTLLELCRSHGVPKFLLASSSSVYGAASQGPYREDADTSRPLSPYAATKKAAETLAYSYHHLHGIDVSVLRYFTVYGPAGRPDMSVFYFIRRIAEGEPVIVFGDGSQRRDFTYIDDVVAGTLAALRPSLYEIINLGGSHPVPLSELIEEICRQLGKAAQIERRAANPMEVAATWADTGKARRLLGWSPQIVLAEGIRRSIAWYRENRQWVLSLEMGER
jgi:nucleoside-diphosphate-sugar epimerase